jgi:hypothetical protein
VSRQHHLWNIQLTALIAVARTHMHIVPTLAVSISAGLLLLLLLAPLLIDLAAPALLPAALVCITLAAPIRTASIPPHQPCLRLAARLAALCGRATQPPSSCCSGLPGARRYMDGDHICTCRGRAIVIACSWCCSSSGGGSSRAALPIRCQLLPQLLLLQLQLLQALPCC